jgi:mxaL protein
LKRIIALLTKVKNGLRKTWNDGTCWFLLALLSLLPIWFAPHFNMNSMVQDTFYVIDVSESMNVQDVDYPKPQTSRLSLAKQSVTESMARLPCGSRVSIGLFAGEETIVLFEPLEICQHYFSIEQVVSRINTNMRWIGDSWIVRGLTSAIKEAQKRKLNLVMLTDADEMPHHMTPRIADLLEYQDKVHGVLWGIGNEALQPIPKIDIRGAVMAYWTPEDAVIEGNYPNLLSYVKNLADGERATAGALDEVVEHLSAFNRIFMQSAAEALHIGFVKINQPKDALKSIQEISLQKQALAPRDARWIFGLIAMLWVLIGWFWSSLLHSQYHVSHFREPQ